MIIDIRISFSIGKALDVVEFIVEILTVSARLQQFRIATDEPHTRFGFFPRIPPGYCRFPIGPQRKSHRFFLT